MQFCRYQQQRQEQLATFAWSYTVEKLLKTKIKLKLNLKLKQSRFSQDIIRLSWYTAIKSHPFDLQVEYCVLIKQNEMKLVNWIEFNVKISYNKHDIVVSVKIMTD